MARDGVLHGVVHNATSGLSPQPVVLADAPIAALRDHFAVSVGGTWALARAAFPQLVSSRGSLLVLTSEAGFEGKARLSPYAAAKAMQRGLARSLAREWGPHGVRVNGLSPLADSPAMQQAFANDPTMSARVLGRNPLGRLGDPVGEIGAAARFLLSEEAAYITGQTLMADGGSCPVT